MYITDLSEDGCEYYLTASFSSTQTVLYILKLHNFTTQKGQIWLAYFRQRLFYGLGDDFRTGLVFYGRDHSADGTIFYRPVLGRLEMYLIFLWTGR